MAVTSGVTPRYHFAGSNGVYLSCRRISPGTPYITRFGGLGLFNRRRTTKWLHALTIRPASALPVEDLCKVPDGTIDNPYAPASSTRKRPQDSTGLSLADARRLEQASASTDQYFFKTRGAQPQGGTFKRQKRIRKKHNVPARMDCWFCLASPTCEKHLIVSVGRETYVCLPKGDYLLATY